ncbi:MAG: DegV family protein [Trueperaceae bacterium]
MPLAVITDSTCDLTEAELHELKVRRVPLYVHFQGDTHKDWIEITPDQLIRGIQDGAALPTTSQPTPEDFAAAYRDAVADGADRILVVTISAELSGTYQSATLAAKDAPVPVDVFDSRNASLGAAFLVRRAVAMRDADADPTDILAALERLRERAFLIFTVGTLEFLQKGGRIGRASAMLGGLLNIKPLLTLENGAVAPAGKARGAKKAIREIVSRVAAYRKEHPDGELVLSFLHIQAEEGAARLKEAITDEGIAFRDAGLHQLGAVIGVHVGPGVHGLYAFADPDPDLGG